MMHVGMDRIDEDHARHFLAMARSEHTKVKCAEVVPNEDVRSRNRSAGEKALQFVGNIRTAARLIGRVTPTETGAIVGTNTRKFTDLWLHQSQDKGGFVSTGLQNDSWTPRALTVAVKSQPADVPAFAGS